MLFYVPEIFSLLAIAVVMVALRVIARWTSVGPRRFAADDYLMPFAAVVYTLEVCLAYPFGYMVKGLANDGIPPGYRANLDPASEEYRLRVMGSKVQLIGWCLYTLLLWLLKLCLAIFFFRLTEGMFDVKRHIQIAIGVLGATYLATLFTILFGCFPFEKNWQVYPDSGNRCQPGVSKLDVFVTAILNVLTDIHLMAIVLPLLWKAKIVLRKKIVLVTMFSGGIFIIIASIIRAVVILQAARDGSLQAGLWACRESFVAIAIGNIPMIYPLIRRIMRKLGLLQSLDSTYAEQSHTGAYGAYGPDRTGGSRSHWRSIQNDAALESDERIMLKNHPSATQSTYPKGINAETSITVESRRY